MVWNVCVQQVCEGGIFQDKNQSIPWILNHYFQSLVVPLYWCTISDDCSTIHRCDPFGPFNSVQVSPLMIQWSWVHWKALLSECPAALGWLCNPFMISLNSYLCFSLNIKLIDSISYSPLPSSNHTHTFCSSISPRVRTSFLFHFTINHSLCISLKIVWQCVIA